VHPTSSAPRSDDGVDGAIDGLATTTAGDSEWPFSEVLERLRRAHLALGQGRASLVLVQLAELDRHAGATLLEERAMTRVLTLCALGEDAAARQAAEPLLIGAARSIYSQRLEQSCAAPLP
jgi:hypothetical protein